MFDSTLRPLIDPPLHAMARVCVKAGMTANKMTALGFAFALISFALLWAQFYMPALMAILLCRFFDGMDGAVARMTQTDNGKTGETDLGGFLDIVSDFVFYAGVVFFFVMGQPKFAIYGAFLLFSFFGAASSFLAYAIIAEKRGVSHEKQGKKSFYYLAGLTEGTETIVFFVLICLFPNWFSVLAFLYGVMCLMTTLGRVKQGYDDFSDKEYN